MARTTANSQRSRNRFRAESEEELNEDDLPEGAEGEEDEIDAEGEEDDIDAEDDTPEAEDEEKPVGKKAKATRSGMGAVAAERARCAGLQAVAAQASRLGVRFNAAKAIQNGTSVNAARARVLDAAASADAGEISTASRSGGRSASARGAAPLTKAAKAAAWKKAIKG